MSAKAQKLGLSPEESAELILALIVQMQLAGTDVESQLRKTTGDFRSRIQAQEADR
jgi:hypothetical protein